MTEVILDVICILRKKGKTCPEAKKISDELIDLFILTPKEGTNA